MRHFIVVANTHVNCVAVTADNRRTYGEFEWYLCFGRHCVFELSRQKLTYF
jgi:hypothetical protein